MQTQTLSLSAHSVNTVIDSFGLNQKMAATDPVGDRDDLMEPAHPALKINYFVLFSSSANPLINVVYYYRLIYVQFPDNPMTDSDQVIFNRRSVIFDLNDDLVPGTTYLANMASGAITDAEGNAYNGFMNASFTVQETSLIGVAQGSIL